MTPFIGPEYRPTNTLQIYNYNNNSDATMRTNDQKVKNPVLKFPRSIVRGVSIIYLKEHEIITRL